MLKRQLALRARLKLAGKIQHDQLFFRDDGQPMRDLNHPYDRWRWTLRMTLKARYREPYNARHSFVSWNLMIGKNRLWVAKQHGHSVSTMLEIYGAWIEGSQAEDLDAIKRAMESSPRSSFRLRIGREIPFQHAEFGTGAPPESDNSFYANGIVWWKGRDSNTRSQVVESVSYGIVER